MKPKTFQIWIQTAVPLSLNTLSKYEICTTIVEELAARLHDDKFTR